MEDLQIIYTLPKRIKIFTLAVACFLLLLSAGISISEGLADKFGLLFYVGIAGVVMSAVSALMVTAGQLELIIDINNDHFRIKLPKQRIDGSVLWETVTQLGIGLSYLTLATTGTNYKIDLGNVKYNDLKKIKTKLIEVCESKNIPYSNI